MLEFQVKPSAMNIQVKYITIKYIAHSSKLQPYSIVKDANGLRLDDEI
jgi:hypothetical protein